MTQTITPELREWIVQQAHTGASPQAIVGAMQSSGWQEDVAIAALEEVMEGHLKALGLPPATPVPWIDLESQSNQLDLGDRQVQVVSSLFNPRVVVLADLLSAEECAGLIAEARPQLARSLTVVNDTGQEEVNPERTSDGMFFHRGASALIERIEARIARLVNWPVERGEGLQVLRYGVGAEYKAHYDYFDPDAPGAATLLKRGGQRVGTLVMYLNQPERGGGTGFPAVGLTVAPRLGGAVFFSYDRPHPTTQTLHAGLPVLAGEKWVATKWLREGPFE